MLVLVAVVAMVLANAFFVSAEFGSVSARRTRVAEMAASGNAAARAILPILRDPARLDNYVAACQIGITASSLVLGFYAQGALAERLAGSFVQLGLASEVIAATAAGALMLTALTGLQIVVGELVPKAIAVQFAERVALVTSVPMRALERAFAPFIALLNGSGTLMLRLLGLPPAPQHAHLHAPEEIELLIAESSQAGALDAESRAMLHNAFTLSSLMARQVMIPRNRLALADISTPVDVLLEQLARSPYSRIPVFSQTPDNIVGIVHLKDLYRARLSGIGTTASLVRSVPVVPSTLPVGRLWQLLNQERTYLAVVLGEHGGTAGIVTQEDLLEEIIGEVSDEFDVEIAPILRRVGQPPVVRGDVLVTEVNDVLGVGLPTDRADTIGGLLVDSLGRLAKAGDQVELAGTVIRAETVGERWVERVTVIGAPRKATAMGEGPEGCS